MFQMLLKILRKLRIEFLKRVPQREEEKIVVLYENNVHGSFTINKPSGGFSFCGMKPNRETFNYQVLLTSDQLDENGFVVDVRDIKRFVDRQFHNETVGDSGEKIAKRIAEEAHRITKGRCSVKATIESSSFSDISYSIAATGVERAKDERIAQLEAELEALRNATAKPEEKKVLLDVHDEVLEAIGESKKKEETRKESVILESLMKETV